MDHHHPSPPDARERLRRDLVPHVRAAISDAAGGRISPDEGVAQLVWLADLYALQVAAVERTGDP